MNADELYEEYDKNGEPIFFVDEDCTKPFSGKIEDYDRGFLCSEGNVVNGFLEGEYREYFFMSNKLECISIMKRNMKNGLSISFYQNGGIESISLVYNNTFFDVYSYDENGYIKNERLWTEDSIPTLPKAIICEYRQMYNLEKVNEEILRDGINFQFERYFNK